MDLQICIGRSRHSECGARASTPRRQAPCIISGLTGTRFGGAVFVTMTSCSAVLGQVVQFFADRMIFLDAQEERIGRVTRKLWRAWVREGLEVPQLRGDERVLCPSERNKRFEQVDGPRALSGQGFNGRRLRAVEG